MGLKVLFPTSLSQEEVKQDFQQARDLGKVRLGKHNCYFTRFSGNLSLPYDHIVRAGCARRRSTPTCAAGGPISTSSS